MNFQKGDRVCHAEDSDFKGTVHSHKGAIVVLVWDEYPDETSWEMVSDLRKVKDES